MVITKILDPKILDKNTQLLITLIVEETGKSSKGTTALILKLLKDSTEENLKFNNEYYITTYPETGKGEIDFDNAIGFSNFDKPESAKLLLTSKLIFILHICTKFTHQPIKSYKSL